MLLSVIVPARNEATLLPRCLESITAAVDRAAVETEIIVVDGGSTDGTCTLAKEAGATVLVPEGCRGRGAALCAGVSVSTGRYLLLLHADTEISTDAVRAALEHLRAEDGACTFSPRFDADESIYWHAMEAWCRSHDSILATFGDAGCAMSRALWDRVGGAPAWPLFDDVELFQRVRRHGARITKLPAHISIDTRRFASCGYAAYPPLCLSLIVLFACGTSPDTLAQLYRTTGHISTRPLGCWAQRSAPNH